MKRSTSLEQLSQDHFAGLLVVRRLRSGLKNDADPEVMASYTVHFWDTYLTQHFHDEETLLTPALDEAGQIGLADRMISEHRALEVLVSRMRSEDATDPSLLDQFAGLLKDHIRFEERQLFPAIEQHASPERLKEIGDHLAGTGTCYNLNWPNQFWDE